MAQTAHHTHGFARLIAVVAVVAGISVFGFVLARTTLFPVLEPEATPAVAAHKATPDEVPVRLSIPSLSIDAAVQSVGIGKSGNMAVPTNFTDVGWYRYGPAPGSVGSAVIDGHVDNGLSLAGVFKQLNEVKVGDKIIVTDASGREQHFTVEDIKDYDYKSVPTELVFNRTDTARLNLVTCDGAWVAGEKTYDRRIVVFAVLTS